MARPKGKAPIIISTSNLEKKLTLISADLSNSPGGIFPSREEDFLHMLKGMGIERDFRNYLKVDGLGRLTGIMGDIYFGALEPDTTTSDFAQHAAESRARWDLFEYLKAVFKKDTKPEPISYEDRLLDDFRETLQSSEIIPGETVLVIDRKVERKYRNAIDELGIEYVPWGYTPWGHGISEG